MLSLNLLKFISEMDCFSPLLFPFFFSQIIHVVYLIPSVPDGGVLPALPPVGHALQVVLQIFVLPMSHHVLLGREGRSADEGREGAAIHLCVLFHSLLLLNSDLLFMLVVLLPLKEVQRLLLVLLLVLILEPAALPECHCVVRHERLALACLGCHLLRFL